MLLSFGPAWALLFNCRPTTGPRTNLSHMVFCPPTVSGHTWLVVLYRVFVWYVARQYANSRLALMSRTVYRNATSRYCECARLPTVLLLTSIRLSPGYITNQQYGYPMDVCKVHYIGILLTVSARLSRPKGYLGGIKASRFAAPVFIMIYVPSKQARQRIFCALLHTRKC